MNRWIEWIATLHIHTQKVKLDMWQSRVEIEHYFVVCFNHTATFEAL